MLSRAYLATTSRSIHQIAKQFIGATGRWSTSVSRLDASIIVADAPEFVVLVYHIHHGDTSIVERWVQTTLVVFVDMSRCGRKHLGRYEDRRLRLLLVNCSPLFQTSASLASQITVASLCARKIKASYQPACSSTVLLVANLCRRLRARSRRAWSICFRANILPSSSSSQRST